MIVKMVAAMLMAGLAKARYLMPLGSSGSLSIDSFNRSPSFSSSFFPSLPSNFGGSSSHPFSSRHSKRYQHGPTTTGKHHFKALSSGFSNLGSGPSYSFSKDLGIGSFHPLTSSISTSSFSTSSPSSTNSLNSFSSPQSSISSFSNLGTYPFSSSFSSSPLSTGASFESSPSLGGFENSFNFDDASPFSSSSSTSSGFDKMPQMPSVSASTMFEKMPHMSSVSTTSMFDKMPQMPSVSTSGSSPMRTTTHSSSANLQQQVPSISTQSSPPAPQTPSSNSLVSTTSSSTIPHMTINFNMPALAALDRGPSGHHQIISTSSVSSPLNIAPAIAKESRLGADKPSSLSAPSMVLAQQVNSANASEELQRQIAPSTTMSISFSIPQFPQANPNASSTSAPMAAELMSGGSQMQTMPMNNAAANDVMMNSPQMMMNSAIQQQQQQQQQMMMSAAASEPHPSFAADLSFGDANLVGNSGNSFDSDNYLSEFTQPSSLGTMSSNAFYYPGFAAGAARSVFPSSSTSGLLGLSFVSPSKSHLSHPPFASPYGIF